MQKPPSNDIPFARRHGGLFARLGALFGITDRFGVLREQMQLVDRLLEEQKTPNLRFDTAIKQAARVQTDNPRQSSASTSTLTLLALGVVYGDIGTSPLYAVKETFSPSHGIPLTPDNVLGGLSTIFWSLMVIVSLKYVVLIMRADNRGEGGIMALIALASNAVKKQTR